ncbi:MAG: hypothetical protein ABMB14_25855 [Myxococcota bacterium]
MVVPVSMVVSLLGALIGGWVGCTSAPVYNTITEVTVHLQTPGGTSRKALEGDQLERAKNCLYSTVEIDREESKSELIQEILLIEVKDRYGDRMFEFYTDENFKGNKGKYYQNHCMYHVIRQPS